MFIKENEMGDITKIMLKLLTNYVGWYNREYQRSGSLVGNRYKSEPVEEERYLFALTRYIHQNPVKAGLVEKVEEYCWSSYGEYIGKTKELTDTYFMLGVLSPKNKKAIEIFKELHNEPETENFKPTDRKTLTDEQVKRKITTILKGEEPHSIGLKPKTERDGIFKCLREKHRSTIGQLERVTGISRGIIARCIK